jgi:chromosome condensin MukBEF ATPase and DNA-binding subunit MukB
MDYDIALLRSGRRINEYTPEELDEAFDELARVRDEAQDALARINQERMRRTDEEVKRLRAQLADASR